MSDLSLGTMTLSWLILCHGVVLCLKNAELHLFVLSTLNASSFHSNTIANTISLDITKCPPRDSNKATALKNCLERESHETVLMECFSQSFSIVQRTTLFFPTFKTSDTSDKLGCLEGQSREGATATNYL